MHKLRRRRSKIARFLRFVILHYGQPVLEARIVAPRWRFAGLVPFHGSAGTHHNAQAGGTADGFLRGGEHDVEVPVVESDFFAAHRADAVDYDKGGRGDFVHELGEGANFAHDACRGVDVGYG